MDSQLSKKVLDKIKSEYPADKMHAVTASLAQYSADKPEAERVQLGILAVANGDVSKLQALVTLALTDYRDLLMQAEYLNDPYNLLQSLLKNLQETQTLSPEEVTETMRASGGTNYRKAFTFLVDMLPQRGKTLNAEQYQLIDKLGRALKLPVKTWKHLTK